MEAFKKLSELIQKHADSDGFIMDHQSVINFIDHISDIAGGCDECAKAMEQYTGGEITKNA